MSPTKNSIYDDGGRQRADDGHASVERVTVHHDGDRRRTRQAARTGSGKPLLPDAKRCSILAAGPPARTLRVSDGSVCEPAMLFHGPIVSTMILIPAKALSIWRCTLSTSEFRNSCILWSSETNA